MNVYRIEYTHRWVDEPDERMSWLVVAASLEDALRTWKSGTPLSDHLLEPEPDSITRLGEAILPPEQRPGRPPVEVPKIRCQYCGASVKAPGYKGPCPQCPPEIISPEGT